MNLRSALLLACVWLFTSAHAAAEPPATPVATARFALIIGVNRSVDRDAALLRYADDDAAKYQDLFRGLGAHTYLLSRLDANTNRLHPQAAGEAREPTRSELLRTLAQVESDVAFARNRRVRTILYVVYSGHGNVDSGEAYVSLEDARLFGKDLDALIFERVGASEYHVIVDACYSSLLASARGPGGKRRTLRGFSQAGGIRPRDNVGLLFSTGTARESHEWTGVESGVFSHEVRSGLYGAADANGDGVVTYPEIVAFVERANAAIPAERFRPDVFARAPRGDTQLLDLRPSSQRQIEIAGRKHAHYQLEDGRGVQIAEFHNDAQQTVKLVRPATSAALFLRRLDDDAEFALPASPDIVRVAELEPEAPLSAARGAATNAYGTLFSLPFGPTWVHPLPSEAVDTTPAEERPGVSARGWFEVALFGVGAAGVTGGILAAASAAQLDSHVAPSTSQAQAAQVNHELSVRRWQEGLGLAIGGAAIAGGVTLLAWPSTPATVQVRASTSRLELLGAF